MAYKPAYFLDGMKHIHTNGLNTRMKAVVILRLGTHFWGADYPSLYADYIPSVGNVFQFDKLIKDDPVFQVDLPSVRAVKPYKVTGNVVAVKLQITSLTTNDETVSPEFQLVGGGLSQFDKANLPDFWSSTYPDRKRFCSWQPYNKILNPGQIDFLYFYHNNDALTGTLRVRYTSTYTDNTTQSVIISSETNLSLHEFWCIPVRDSLLATSAKTLKRVLVEVIDGTNASLCSQLYHYVPRASETPVQLFFRNSFNLWDTVTLYGKASASTEVSTFQYEKANAVGQGVISGYNKLNLNTGQMDVEWLQHLNELIYSPEVYLFGRGGFRKLIKLGNSLDWLVPIVDNNQTLEFRFAETDKFYSKIL